MEHLFKGGRVDIDILVDGQFVGDGVQILSQEPVVVEGSDEIFHHVVLLL